MKLTFTGTGTSQGVPIIGCTCAVCLSEKKEDKRLRSSVIVESANTRFVIDTGPDFRYQMLANKINKLDAVLYTHEHRDHISGLDDIRAYNYIQRKAMPLYCSHQVENAIRRDYSYIFAEEKYPGIPEVEFVRIENTEFSIGDIKILPIEVMHYRMPVKAFRINSLAYITDANYISNIEKSKLQNLDVLIVNALRREKHISHYTLDEAIQLSKELRPRKTFFTHISHQLGLHHEINSELPHDIKLAYDGMEIEFD